MMRKLFLRNDREVLLAAVILTVATTLAFAPDAFLPMLARAFLLEWIAVFGLLLGWGLWRRQAWHVGASFTGLVMLLLQVDAPVAPAFHQRTDPALRVAQMNLLQPNRRHAEVVRLALTCNADVISFQEVNDTWAAALVPSLASAYPFHRVVPGNDCYGLALFSRKPLEQLLVHYLEDAPVIEAVVRSDAGPVRVLSVHASSPGSLGEHRRRNLQLDELASLVRRNALPTMVVGDLNTVSWDRAMWRFCQRSGSRIGTMATRPTFPSLFGLSLIPIDHVLVTPGLSVVRSGSFLIPGSDHRGLIADIAA